MKYLVLGFLFTCGTVFAQNNYPTAPDTDPLKVKQYVLENGLTVLLTENHNTSQIFGVVAVRAGGKNDPKEATGMAHYLEHMLFKGTQDMGTWDYEKEAVHLKEIELLYEELGQTTDEAKRTEIQQKINAAAVLAGQYAIPNEMDRMLSEIGSTKVNAFTTEDFTAYFNEFPANKLEHWLSIYDHRFEQPVFRLFQSELETVYEEKNRSMDSPFSPVLDEFNKNFWKNHPYGQQPIIGLTEHLKNPSLQKMYAYFNTYYVANNMVLALSGDFDAEETMVLIRQYFSDWRTGELPVFPTYNEAAFAGKETVNVKMTPVKGALRGYRTPANGHPDQQKVQLANYLLSNSEGSGLIDNLSNEGKISYGGMIQFDYNDYAGSVLFYVPKIIGQSFEEADALVDAQLDKLRKGEFDEKFFEGAKLSLQKDFERKLEDNESRALMLVSAFTSNTPWLKYMDNFAQIKRLTKADIVATIQQYFGPNYLAMYSGMGTAKKDKLAKPAFEPVIPKDGKVSTFTQQWRQTPTPSLKARFVDFDQDLVRTDYAKNITFRSVPNPFNEIFNLRISWGSGTKYDPLLKYVPAYLNKLGTHTTAVSAFRESLFQLGASMYFTSTENELRLEIEGIDKNLDATLLLIKDFMAHVEPTEEAVAAIANETSSERKLNNKDLSNLLRAATEYALYGEESTYLQELTSTEIKKLKPTDLMASLARAQQYGVRINYTGTQPHAEVEVLLKKHIDLSAVANPAQPKKVRKPRGFEDNKVYFLNDKKAVQTQIMFTIGSSPMALDMQGDAAAFNLYFGGDMSSLVFQEIREFRSLAYSTYARYNLAPQPGHDNLFFAFVGCQGDKTPESLEIMNSLITQMPEKREREDAIRSALVAEAKSSRPGFRNLIETVDTWEEMGLQQDPNQNLIPYYNDLSFDQIVTFYKAQIQGRNRQIIVVGNAKKFNTKELKKYGRVIQLQSKKVVKN
jgi:zinc protease